MRKREEWRKRKRPRRIEALPEFLLEMYLTSSQAAESRRRKRRRRKE